MQEVEQCREQLPEARLRVSPRSSTQVRLDRRTYVPIHVLGVFFSPRSLRLPEQLSPFRLPTLRALRLSALDTHLVSTPAR
jgi:hypothetical protein